MEHEEKIKYLKIAAGMVGFNFREVDLDKLVSVYDGVLDKKGKYTVKDAVDVMFEVDKREEVREKQRLLDKVSEKVGEKK